MLGKSDDFLRSARSSIVLLYTLDLAIVKYTIRCGRCNDAHDLELKAFQKSRKSDDSSTTHLAWRQAGRAEEAMMADGMGCSTCRDEESEGRLV